MKKLILLIFLFSFFSLLSEAQFSRYIITFKDKAGTPFSINNPSQFLSPRAIARRTRQHISIDETDLPITPRYIDSARLAGTVTILNRSKWLNQVCILTTDAAALAKINGFSFVKTTQPLMRPNSAPVNKFKEDVGGAVPVNRQSLRTTANYYDYGTSLDQIHIHEGEYLHNNGFHGEGMLLAILDDGFNSYLTITAFDSVRNNHQIIETYDFVNNEVSVNEDDTHGMYCFSTIAANWPGQLVGSCPKANYYLYRTENAFTEYPIEEQNWAAAAERADSIGVDVISTSLGYTTFDNPVFNHTYADMNGNVTIAARAADFAAKKGMIVCAAAGNDGTAAWHFIGTPADADSIITVGATNHTGVVASFSSYGPSSDGQVKPTVASVGISTALAGLNNLPTAGNGTSFATPNMAGLVTCFWQAFPDFTNMEIIEAIKRSSSIYTTPDNRIGYGIPNFHTAFTDLSQQRLIRIQAILGNDWIKVYPNPFSQIFTILVNPQNSGTATLQLFDAGGKLFSTKQVIIQQSQPQYINFELLQPLAKGIYTLKFNDGATNRSVKIMAK